MFCSGILAVMALSLPAQVIVDAQFDDWTSDMLTVDEPNDSSVDVNLESLTVSSSDTYLFCKIKLDQVINIQNDNTLSIYIDFDQDATTGLSVAGLGAELVYNFGTRSGTYYFAPGRNLPAFHNEIGLVTLPTVTSNEFEIAIKRSGQIFNRTYSMGPEVNIAFSERYPIGDQLPDDGGLSYAFANGGVHEPDFVLEQPASSDFRIVSYNSEFDGLFENATRDRQLALLRAVDADIISIQEVYDHDADDIISSLQTVLNGTFYGATVSPDVHCISRYPIKDYAKVYNDGNGAFVLDVDGQDVLVIVAHLPCCENEQSRQAEADRIMATIREIQLGEGRLDLAPNSPIIITGDLNLVGDQRQLETLITGDIYNSLLGPDFRPDWDGSDLEDATPIVTNLPVAYTFEDENSSFSAGKLDYIIYTGSVMRAVNSYVLETGALAADVLDDFQLPQNASNASDHLPVVVDFSLDLTASDDVAEELVLKMWPTPARDHLQVDWAGEQRADLRIMDWRGQGVLLASDQRSGVALDVSALPAGSYVLCWQGQSGQACRPFVKQ